MPDSGEQRGYNPEKYADYEPQEFDPERKVYRGIPVKEVDSRVVYDAEGNPRAYVERRRKKDWVVRAVNVLAAIGWMAAVVALVFLDRASPDSSTMFSTLLGAPVRSSWNTQMLWVILVLLVMVFLVCVVGFFFNMSRHRRKSDKYSKSILILGGISAVGIVAFLIRFASML